MGAIILNFTSDIIPIHVDFKVADLHLSKLIPGDGIIIHLGTGHKENCWQHH